LRVLSDATAILSESLDCEVTLANVARSLVPRFAEACVVRLVDGSGLRPLAVECAGPDASMTEDDDVPARVARTGASELVAEGAGERLVVPIRARQETVGVMILSSSRRTYDDRDRGIIEEIASRTALAIDRARLYRDVEAQRVQLGIITDTSRALAAQLDVEGVARAIARAMHAGVLVGLASGADPTIVVRACTSTDETIEERLRSLIGRALSVQPGTVGEEVLRTREPRVVVGADAADRLQPALAALARELGLGSAVVAPLIVQGRPIGIMSVFRRRGDAPLGLHELTLTGEIADRVAVAFERARLFEAQQRATDRLRLLADAGILLAHSLEVDPTLGSLARLAVGWFAQACAVDLIQDGCVTSVAVAAADPSLETALRCANERCGGGSGLPVASRPALESGSARLLREVDAKVIRELALNEDHCQALLSLGFRSLIVVPLVARGGPVGVLSLARTTGPAYDEEDLALGEELGRRAALAVDNARLFNRATEAIAVRDEFLAIASHELNTPLTPLKMQLDSLRRGKYAPERTIEKLDAASRQVSRLAKLVSELLDVSRISGGRLRIERERFDLAALVDEIAARMSEEAERAGSHFSVRVDRPCIGPWDRMRIDQVLTNLLTNAVKYGGGKPIEVELVRRSTSARLIVRDHGIGIALEDQRRIFERFERAASPRHYGGFGLGLWIARQIVEASGGNIQVESAPGEGSTFVVDLPRQD
jgi:signal transduction histidine kinase